MKFGNLGEQIVIKSKQAFDAISYKGYELAEGKKYFPLRTSRMEKAKSDYRESLDKADISGLFIRDFIYQTPDRSFRHIIPAGSRKIYSKL